jgi:hypothetical protein
MSAGVIVAVVIVIIILLVGGGVFFYVSTRERPARDPTAVDAVAQQLAAPAGLQTAPAGLQTAPAGSQAAPLVAATAPTQYVAPPAKIPADVARTMPLNTLFRQIDDTYAIVMSATTSIESKKAAMASTPAALDIDAAAKNAMSSSSDPAAAKAASENIMREVDSYKRKIKEMQAAVQSAERSQKPTVTRPCGTNLTQAQAAGCVAVAAMPIMGSGCAPGYSRGACPSNITCKNGALCFIKKQIPAGKTLVDAITGIGFFK